MAVPPWMLFWLVSSLIVAMPGQLSILKASFLSLVGASIPGEPNPVAAGLEGGAEAVAAQLVSVVDLVPPLLTIAAICTVVGLPLRRRFVERRYKLTDTDQRPVLAEITAFARECAPGVAVRSRMRRTDIAAFAYPRGFRSAGLAVFGKLALMWRRDREAAQMVIRHELSHCRQGDTLTIGAVSPLDEVLRRWMWIVLAFGIVPTSIVWVASSTDLLRGVGSSGISYTAGQFLTQELPDLALLTVMATAQVMALITMPIAASWSAELAADHFAAARGEVLVRALSGRHSGGTRWLRGRITHPPTALRRALADASATTQLLTATLVYPAAWLVQLFWVTLIWLAICVEDRYSVNATLNFLRIDIVSWADSLWPLWAAALATALLWPVIGRSWRHAVAASS